MKSKMYEIKCSHCRSTWMIKCETLVHAQSEGTLRKKILEGSFFTRKCSVCDELITFYYPFLYCDSKHKFLVAIVHQDAKWLKDLESLDQYADFRKRIVRDERELKEKIHIFECGLDDEGIAEIQKKVGKLYNYLYFESCDQDLLWFQSDKGPIGVEKRFYHEKRENGHTFMII